MDGDTADDIRAIRDLLEAFAEHEGICLHQWQPHQDTVAPVRPVHTMRQETRPTMSDRDALTQIIQAATNNAPAYWEAGEVADAILARWELTPFKACGHPDRYDLRGENDECIACNIENGD